MRREPDLPGGKTKEGFILGDTERNKGRSRDSQLDEPCSGKACCCRPVHACCRAAAGEITATAAGGTLLGGDKHSSYEAGMAAVKQRLFLH